jgi:hypothetical protein
MLPFEQLLGFDGMGFAAEKWKSHGSNMQIAASGWKSKNAHAP